MARSDSTRHLDDARYHVPNLERALMILEHLAATAQPAGMSDLARALDLPKNSVFRIVSTLHAHGYLRRDVAGKEYRLSRKLLSLGYAAIDENSLLERALSTMRRIRDLTDETTLIGTLVDDHGVVIEQVPSDQPVKCLIRIGHQFPLHSAAPAKAMLAFLPEAEREAIVARMTFPRFTERTITDPDRYREELTEARRLGYALDRGEELSDLTCAAAPVLNHRGYPIAGIWVTGPASRMPIDQLPKIGELVAEHVASVSMRFGYVVGEEETGDPALSTSADR